MIAGDTGPRLPTVHMFYIQEFPPPCSSCHLAPLPLKPRFQPLVWPTHLCCSLGPYLDNVQPKKTMAEAQEDMQLNSSDVEYESPVKPFANYGRSLISAMVADAKNFRIRSKKASMELKSIHDSPGVQRSRAHWANAWEAFFLHVLERGYDNLTPVGYTIITNTPA